MSVAAAHSPVRRPAGHVRAHRTLSADTGGPQGFSPGVFRRKSLAPAFSVLLFGRRPSTGADAASTDRPTVPASSHSSKTRVALIDHARGLFLFWMVVAHALGLAGVRDSSPLAFLIPPKSAWLSERFVVLSGFTVRLENLRYHALPSGVG